MPNANPNGSESLSRVQLPNDIEAEQAVLASCMLNEEVCNEICLVLKPENFFRPSHQTIFEAIFEINRSGKPADAISLADKLQAKGQLESAGDRTYLSDLNANTFALTNWHRHMEIVRRTSIQRGLIRAAAEINAIAYDAPEDVAEVVEEAEQALFAVTEKRITSTFIGMEDLMTEAFDNLLKISAQDETMLGVPTGFKDVDELFHGLRAGDLAILAARPGVGKTSFALNLAVNAAYRGVEVLFFSLEMNHGQIAERILGSEARINISKLRSGRLAEGEWTSVADAIQRLTKAKMHIDDTPGLSILEARAKARREFRDIVGTDQKGLIIVDYLQLMEGSGLRKDSSRAVEVGEISRGLKILAKEMDMPVIALSQLNRGVEFRGKKRPMLADLRESGSIEQDADIVMFIDRSMDEAEAAEDGRPDLGMATLIVAKHRNGPTRDIKLAFQSDFTKFSDFIDDARFAV